MKLTFFNLSLLLLTCLIIACSSDETVTPEITIEDTVDYFSEPINFPSSGGSKIIKFNCNVKWTMKVSETQGAVTWCKVSQYAGDAGSISLSVIVDENNSFSDRNVVLILQAGNVVKNVIVNQKQNNAITLTTDRFEVNNSGGTIDVEVKSNINYNVEIPERFRSWISQTSSTRALSSSRISFIIAENTEYDKREGEILITSDDITERIKVYQTGTSILILSQNEFTLGCEGGIISVDISSNFEFVTDMPNVEWIRSVETTRGMSSHTLSFTIDENTTYDNREAVIIFKDTNSDKRESVTIKQKQENAIILSNNIIEIPQEGGTFLVNINSNVDYTVNIPVSCNTWVSKAATSTTRSLTTSTCSFVISRSEELQKREGEVYFCYNDIVDTLKIYQSGGSVLVLSQDTYNLEGGATTISVQVKSNNEYTISTSNEWINEISTRAVSSSIKYFSIAKNKTGENRVGKITFKTIDGLKTAEVIINQASIIEVQSLNISFTNTSGTIGGRLYIGKNYNFTVTATPSNAATNYEWRVEDANIASISANGNKATLSTKDYGISKVTVTETNSGISESYEFGTCVTDFQFTENSRETKYGYPVIKMAIGDQHQLKCSYTPSYATNIFSDLRPFNFKEVNVSINTYVIVDKSSIVDIDSNGRMTAKKIGTTIIESNNGYGVFKNGSNDGVFIEVVEEISPYGSIGGHGYVDLGLPSGKLWATENFGAFGETDYGAYYMWSDTDRVPSSWGNKWSTPTRQDFNELLNNCSYNWTIKNGVNGYLFTGQKGATLFLPAAGFKNYIEGYGYSNVQMGGQWLLYWTSNKSSDSWEGQDFAFVLNGTSTSITTNTTYNTTIVAASIRPISR